MAIKEYLDYIRTNDDSRGYTTKLLQKTVGKVQEVRSDDKMEVSYMMWQLKFQDAREEGRVEGRAEGIILSIQNLMKRMNLSAEQAMEAIGVSKEEQPQYLEMLKQWGRTYVSPISKTSSRQKRF